mgnify:FL=1
MSKGIFLFMLGMSAVILGVGGIEGTVGLAKGFVISFAGIVTMFISVAYMARHEPENLLDGDWDD